MLDSSSSFGEQAFRIDCSRTQIKWKSFDWNSSLPAGIDASSRPVRGSSAVVSTAVISFADRFRFPFLFFVFRFVFLTRSAFPWRMKRSHRRAAWNPIRKENRGFKTEKQGNQEESRELEDAVESRGFDALGEENGAGVGVVDEKIVNARDDARIVFLCYQKGE